MRINLLKFKKVLTGMSCFSLIVISNNLELAAKFVPVNEKIMLKNKIKDKNTPKNQKKLFSESNYDQNNSLLIADNGEKNNAKSVLVSEIIIDGWEDHPEGRKLELAAYDSMSIKTWSIIDNQILKEDLYSFLCKRLVFW